jgi:enoyl-CoA hydratase
MARITLRSPDGENRIGEDALDDLRSACKALTGDSRVRVLVLGSEGDVFSLGWSADLLEAAGGDSSVLPGDVFGCLAELPLPVIAEIQGDAVSAGLELALACDLRVAAPGARFAFPESEFGLIPLAGGTQRLPRIIGRGRALQMLLLAQVLDATQALDWGLVNELAAAGGVREAAVRMAGSIAGRGPIAERFAKEAVQLGTELPLARALRYELDLTVLLQTTEDRAEGVRAFVEKRPPGFTGR